MDGKHQRLVYLVNYGGDNKFPAFYYDGNKFVVAETKEKALLLAQKENPNVKITDLRQDEDVLDTWFSSWIWPISCLME